jgi:hypothetical protein
MYKTFLIIILAIIPLTLFGQIPGFDEELSIISYPESPEPFEEVRLQLVSDSDSLSGSSIIWVEDGINKARGIGQKSYETKMGDVGQKKNIEVSVTKEDGTVLTTDILIIPNKIDLIWEADTYTPLFYKGKALAGHQSKIKVVVVSNIIGPNGNRLSSKDINYKWSIDGKDIRDSSGFGKEVFFFNGALISNPKNISVTIYDKNNTLLGNKSISVNFIDPIVLIYKKDPLTSLKGTFPIKVGRVKEEETNFISEPYFFSKSTFKNKELNYKWVVDGSLIESYNKRNFIAFDGETKGESSVSVQVYDTKAILQSAKNSFKVIVE